MAGQKLFTIATWLIGAAVALIIVGAIVHVLIEPALLIAAAAVALAAIGIVVAVLAQLEARKPRVHHVAPRYSRTR